MTEMDIEKLRALDAAATAGDLSTVERHTEHEHIECPVCQGDGEVLATDYCNIDGKALGVQFYGIGNEFGAHEALWTYLVHSVPAILALAEREKRMREALERLSSSFTGRWAGMHRDRSAVIAEVESIARAALNDGASSS